MKSDKKHTILPQLSSLACGPSGDGYWNGYIWDYWLQSVVDL